jgi:hypothetical protein
MSEKINSALRRMILSLIPQACITGKVESVDTAKFTVDVKPADGGPVYYDVRIKSIIDNNETGLIILPKIGAEVLMIRIDDHNAAVLLASEVDRIYFKANSGRVLEIESEIKLNGDDKGGLLIHNEVKAALDQINQNVSAIKAACIAGFTALSPLDASASLNSFTASSASVAPANTSNLQNSKVKHGSI